MSPDRRSPVRYQIVVRGELGGRFEAVFDGWELEPVAGTTVITGCVRDQAHLAGVIDRLQELGLEIVSLSELETPSVG